MGNYDSKNFIIKIGIRECCADQRYLDFMNKTNYNYTIEEVGAFIKNNYPQYHPLAEKIVRFFIDYDNGIMLPDKYSEAEPIRLDFNKDDIVEPVANLSYLRGFLFLKKNVSMMLLS